MITLNGANVVIIAQDHNPSVASYQLISEHIILEEIKDFVHTPEFSSYESDTYTLTIDAQRWQLVPKNVLPATLDSLPKIAFVYAKLLPYTPFKAVGFNFEWRSKCDTKEALLSKMKSLFVKEDGKLAQAFAGQEYLVTGTVQFSYEGFVVTAVMAPQTSPDNELKVNLNYHRAISSQHGETLVEEMKAVAGRFTELYQYGEKLLGDILE